MTEEAGKLAEELKPCPFCGHGQSMVDPWFDDVSKRWAIGCGRCGASSGRSVHAKGSKEAAIRSWNTRPSHEAETQDERQRVVVEWGERAFGVDHMQDKIVRAARFFEEAAEMVQAVGLPRDHAQRAFDHVYSRAPGDPAQEAGGAANTLMALCGAIGLSLDECQRAEIERCLAKDPAHFAARNEAKLREVDATPEAGTQEPVAWQYQFLSASTRWTEWTTMLGSLKDFKQTNAKCDADGKLKYRPLYAAPASQDATREATDEQIIAALEWSLEWMRRHNVDGLSPFKDYPPVKETIKGMYSAMIAASPARADRAVTADDGAKAAFPNKSCQSNGEGA